VTSDGGGGCYGNRPGLRTNYLSQLHSQNGFGCIAQDSENGGSQTGYPPHIPTPSMPAA